MVELSSVIWILLISARLPTGAIRFAKDGSWDATLPPLPNPPVTDTPQENFGGTPPADLLTRCGWVGIDASSNPVDLSEEFLVEQWRELLRGVLYMLNNLLVDLLRRHTLFGQVIKNGIDFDGIPFETFVDVRGLDQVSEIRKTIQVLRTE